jgi:leader peptidase (prepilin peptidase)/N-methyltransferase
MTWVISLFFIDLETYLLPDKLTLTLLWLGLLASAFGLTPVNTADAIWGACLGYALPWSVNQLYKLIRHHDGFGGGDFKLLGALGAWTGWIYIVPILCIASLLGLACIVVLTLLKHEPLSLNKAFPFGPFLILSGVGIILFGI